MWAYLQLTENSFRLVFFWQHHTPGYQTRLQPKHCFSQLTIQPIFYCPFDRNLWPLHTVSIVGVLVDSNTHRVPCSPAYVMSTRTWSIPHKDNAIFRAAILFCLWPLMKVTPSSMTHLPMVVLAAETVVSAMSFQKVLDYIQNPSPRKQMCSPYTFCFLVRIYFSSFLFSFWHSLGLIQQPKMATSFLSHPSERWGYRNHAHRKYTFSKSWKSGLPPLPQDIRQTCLIEPLPYLPPCKESGYLGQQKARETRRRLLRWGYHTRSVWALVGKQRFSTFTPTPMTFSPSSPTYLP